MDEKYYGKIVSKNLKRIMYERNKTQADMCRDLKLNKSTVSSWMTGKRVPRMDKIDMLCEYFNCKRSDIMIEHLPNEVVPFVVLEALEKDRERLIKYARALVSLSDLEDLNK